MYYEDGFQVFYEEYDSNHFLKLSGKMTKIQEQIGEGSPLYWKYKRDGEWHRYETTIESYYDHHGQQPVPMRANADIDRGQQPLEA